MLMFSLSPAGKILVEKLILGGKIRYFLRYSHTTVYSSGLRDKTEQTSTRNYFGRVSKLNLYSTVFRDSRVRLCSPTDLTRSTLEFYLETVILFDELRPTDKKVGLPAHTNDQSN